MKKNFLLALFILFISFAKSQESIWTPEESMKIKSISQVNMSEDGKYITYVVREAIMEEEKSEYLSQIWVSATDKSFNEKYTHSKKSSTSPKFSPNGKSIAFLSLRSGKNQIWIMNSFGGEAKQITESKDGIKTFKWSSDGEFIAFTMNDPETKEEKKLKKEKRDVILVDKNFKYAHLYVINPDDKKSLKKITTGNFSINSFDWSPSGKNIVFSHQKDTNINTGFINTDISEVQIDNGIIKSLIKRPGLDSNPIYSNDGRSIAFVSSGGKIEPIGLKDIYVYSLENNQIKKLSETPNRSANILSWTPDDKNILIIESISTNSQVMSVEVSGDKIKYITSKENSKYPTGYFSSLAFNKSKSLMAYCYEDLKSPIEVYFSKSKKFKNVKISNINSELKYPELAISECISWKSKDGLEIEGILTYPKNYEKGKKYPIILQIHGGPAGVFSERFSGRPGIYMTEYFAEKGYATIKPNPRGSTGYGKDFRYANYRDWGYGDFNDVTSGVDKVIEMGIADKNRQFVMGWSYGGYLTSFVVTKTDRFKAASMGAGLPNLVSMVTTTDIQDYIVGHMGAEFWDDYDTYEKHSAIYQIKNVVTPTQVIHGEKDLRVPFTQGQEFYRALNRLGVETEMIVYPRTPHGPREPKLLMDVSERILKWFEKFIPKQ
ncbi:MAG: hypothetical protein CMC38_00720 [Flavobacteriaceae bacterium]|nr:hypothetical protein [Flavobacteriaceae bacterium]